MRGAAPGVIHSFASDPGSCLRGTITKSVSMITAKENRDVK